MKGVRIGSDGTLMSRFGSLRLRLRFPHRRSPSLSILDIRRRRYPSLVDDHHHPRRGPNHHHPGSQDQGAGQVCLEEEQDGRKLSFSFDRSIDRSMSPSSSPILSTSIYTSIYTYPFAIVAVAVVVIPDTRSTLFHPDPPRPTSTPSFPPRSTSTSIRSSPILSHRLRFHIVMIFRSLIPLPFLFSLRSLFALATRNS